MRRMLKIAGWTLATLLLLLVVASGGLILFGNTDFGRSTIAKLTYRLSGGHVEVEGLSGSFPRHLRIDRLQLRDSLGVWLSADKIVLDWSPLAYMQGRLQLDYLQAAKVDMQRLPQGSPSPSRGEVSIPRIDASRVNIDRVQLGPQLAGAPASLVAFGSAHLNSLRDMQIDATARRIGGDGEYLLHLNFDPQQLSADLKLQEPAGGPLENIVGLPGLGALRATLQLSGKRSAEQLRISVQAGGLQGQAQGLFNVNDLSADLSFAVESPAMSPRPDLAWDGAVLKGRWRGSVTSPTGEGHLQINRLRLPGGTQLAALSADLAADLGRAELHGRVSGLRIPGREPGLLEANPIEIGASLRLDDPARRLELTATHPLFSLSAQALTAGKHSANLELRVANLAPLAALAGEDVRGSALVKAQLEGYPADTHMKLEASAALIPGAQLWAVALGERATVQMSLRFQEQSLTVENLTLAGHALSLSAGGSLSGGNLKGRWDLKLTDLGTLSPILAGAAKASGSLDGATTALNATMMMTSTMSVRGSAPGTISAAAKVRGLPASPNGAISIDGSFDGAPLHVEVDLDRSSSSSSHAVIRQANWKSAHLEGEVSLNANQQPHGQLTVAVAQLSDLQNLLGTDIGGSLSGSLMLRPDGQRTRAQLQIEAQQLALSHWVGQLQVGGEGFTDSFGYHASIQLPDLNGAAANLTAQGTLNFDAREVWVASALLNYRDQEAKLLSPARVSFGDGVAVDQLRIGAQSAELLLQGQIAPSVRVHAALRGVGPALVNAFVPNFLSSGLIEAHADLQGSATSPVGQIELNATGLRRADEAALGLPAANLKVTAELQQNTAAIHARLDAGPGSGLSAAGQLPLAVDGAVDLKINGNFEIGMINPYLEARGLHATGQLGVDAAVSGSVAAPQIGGTVELTKGSIRDYARGISLSDITAQLTGSEGALQIKTFTASAAPGTLSMSGSVGVLQPAIPVDLKITARNAQPIVSNLVTSNLNADLHISGTARERLNISGKLLLNRTLIGIPNGLPANVAVLDVRRRGKPAGRVVEKPLIVALDMIVQAPQQLLVQGRGLDAEMGGELHIGGTADAPLVSGQFDLQRGSFSLAGSRLNFTEGRVSFNGSGLKNRIDPTLDFTASAAIADNTQATMRITGFADAPIFEFTSNPTMPQDEIMSLLMFGVPASQLTGLQLAQIGVALASLSGVGGGDSLNPLAKIQKSLGLDRLQLGSGTTTTTPTGTENSGASIAAGRYISKRVYLEARQTTAGTSQVGAAVDLTKHLKLQTRLGNGTASLQGTTPENDPGSSIGLVYQFEY